MRKTRVNTNLMAKQILDILIKSTKLAGIQCFYYLVD